MKTQEVAHMLPYSASLVGVVECPDPHEFIATFDLKITLRDGRVVSGRRSVSLEQERPTFEQRAAAIGALEILKQAVVKGTAAGERGET